MQRPGSLRAIAVDHYDYMLEKNYAEDTAAIRLKMIGYFIEWCEMRDIENLSQITTPVIERFQKHLYQYRKEKNDEPLSFANQSQRVSALRKFFSWCVRKRLMLYNPAAEVELPRSEKRLPKYVLTQSEAESILMSVDLNEEDGTGIRDRAILEVLYSSGIRRIELTNLKIYDLDTDRGTLMINQGKGRRDRVVPVGERAIAWIEKYLNTVRPYHVAEPDPGNLFLTVKGEQIHEDYLSGVVKGYVEKSGVGKKGSCHLFRHTMATLLLENGADIRFIQAMLGHTKLNSTEVYTHVGIKRLKEIHSALHPGANLQSKNKKPEPRCEGILKKDEHGRFILGDRTLAVSAEIELLVGHAWIAGELVELSHGVHFLDSNTRQTITLAPGMKARISGKQRLKLVRPA